MKANPDSPIRAVDILVVDDSITSLRMLTEILLNAGCIPRPVEDPHLAIEAALAQPPDLILLDVKMPKMSGFEVCRQLKQDERTRDIPVIFVSALDQTQDQIQGFEVGGVDFISKPIQEPVVLARVKTHLQLRDTLSHLEQLVDERTAEIERLLIERTLALETAEGQIRSLFENAQLGIGLTNREGEMLSANRTLLEMTGYEEDEILNTNVINLYQEPKQRTQLLEKMQYSVAVHGFPVKLLRKDGTDFYANMNVSKLNSEGRDIFLTVIEDMDEKIQAEQKLRESEEKYRDLVERVSDVIYALDSKGVVTYVSPTIESILGLSPDQIIGQPFIDFIIPEDLERAKVNIGTLMDGEQPGLSDYRVLSPSGEVRWIRVSSLPIINEGRAAGFQGILTDITESKHAETVLQESEQRFRTFFHSIPLPSYLWQHRGEEIVLIDCNTAAVKFTQGGVRKMIGSVLTEMYTDRPDIVEDVERCFADKVTIQREMNYTFRSTGEVRDLAVIYAFAPPDLIMVQAEDISDRKLLEGQVSEAAVRAERDRISRDLHDAVTQSLYSASLIAETVPVIWEDDPEQGRLGLKQLERFTKGALAEMRTLLLEMHPKSITDQDLPYLIRQLSEGMMSRAKTRVAVTTVGDCRLPPEVKLALYRVTQEALNNVVKHARASQIQITLKDDSSQVTLCISDDGKGFDTQDVKSHGWGINNMKTRVQEIGGEMSITSQFDQGTEINVICAANNQSST